LDRHSIQSVVLATEGHRQPEDLIKTVLKILPAESALFGHAHVFHVADVQNEVEQR
jgi:hypothetical protein